MIRFFTIPIHFIIPRYFLCATQKPPAKGGSWKLEQFDRFKVLKRVRQSRQLLRVAS